MLQALRGKKSSIFIKILLVVITIGFSFWGIESYLVAGVDNSVAKVNGTDITQDQFRERFDQNRQRMLQMSGGQIDASFFERPELKRQVLDQLVNEELLRDANKKLGLAITNERVRKEIMAVPAFQKDGHFDPDTYRMMLTAQGMSAASFDDRVRQSLAVGALPDQVRDSIVVPDSAVDAYLRLKDQKRDFRFVKLDKPATDTAPVSDDEAQAYFKEHAADFVTPERVSLDYLELDASKMDVATTADDATLKERYEKEKSRFVSNEQRLASHILVKVPGKGGPDDQKQALAKAQDLAAQVKSGKAFADVAKAASDDLGSKNQGGDLGWLEKGTTDEAFETALFAMNKGDVSEPVLTGEGYSVIELRDVRPGKTRSFDDVKPELAKEFATSERERVYADKAGRLTDLTYQDPSSLDSAAKELNLTVQKTDLFARTGGAGDIASNPKVLKAAFADGVLVQNNNSDPIELGPNHIVVVRIAERKPAAPKTIDEVRDQINARIEAERTTKKAKEHADALYASLGKGQSLEQAAATDKLKVDAQTGIGRDAVNVDSNIVTAAFALPRPQGDTPQRQLVALGDDAFALLEVTKVTDGDPSKLDAKTKEAARNTLEQGFSATATREFVDALRASAKVTIAEGKLDQQQ
jgi:peptidyl-prolyl cis-trans isomerase D